MARWLPSEVKSQEFWDIKLEIGGHIYQEKKIGTGFNKA